VSFDPKNYQWHFANPQIVGDYNFIEDYKKFNKKKKNTEKENTGKGKEDYPIKGVKVF